MARLFPDRSQWKGWSLPSKATYIGVWLAVLGVVMSIGLFAIDRYRVSTTADTPRERPWVLVARIDKLNWTLDEASTANIVVRNTGNAPAHEVKVGHAVTVIGKPSANPPLQVGTSTSASNAVVGQGQKIYSRVELPNLKAVGLLEPVRSKASKVFLYVRIEYRDSEGNVYTTEHCEYFVTAHRWDICSHHNRAS